MRRILPGDRGTRARPTRLCADRSPTETALHPTDVDPQETREWLRALDAVVANDGVQRAQQLVESVIDRARRVGAPPPDQGPTPYVNTIPPPPPAPRPGALAVPPPLEAPFSGDLELEHKIRSAIRWNAMAMVLQANKVSSELGGHIASFQSAATLYEVGFNHFWHAPSDTHGGDLVFIQGHSSPGIYARAYLEGRLTDEQMKRFRQELDEQSRFDGGGLASYPHPWLMPDFWQFPTVSMGLGPLIAIYQARFMKYLQGRGMANTEGRKVWAFLGDGETDEPESLGAISLAAREKLANLVFVVNCNLQRLDGPVRGNGKIIQELETIFRGAGWNVIKVIWGRRWDPLLEADREGLLVQRMNEAVDGEYQTYKARNGAYVREHFFNTPELKELVKDYSDEDIWNLNRGGHDPFKVYAAYHAAVNHTGQPTVILAKTIKGYQMGEEGEGMNIAHQIKKLSSTTIKKIRDRFALPVADEKLEEIPYLEFEKGSPELEYMRGRRQALGGYLPSRRTEVQPLVVPELSAFERFFQSSEDREPSTTVALVQILQMLARDKNIGKYVVPIVPDEARTFGMEGMFRQIGIWSHTGQRYTPQDAAQLMFYKEDKKGQFLEAA